MWPGPAGAGGSCPPCGLLGQSRRSLAGRVDCVATSKRRVWRRLRGALGLARGSQPRPGGAPQSPGGGLRKGWRLPDGLPVPSKEVTVLELVRAALKLPESLLDHVRHQQPRGGEEAAGEHAKRLTGSVTRMQEEIPTCQGGECQATPGEGTESMPGSVRPILYCHPPDLSSHFLPHLSRFSSGGLFTRASYGFLWRGLRRFDFLHALALLDLVMKFVE